MSDDFDPYHVWLGIPPDEQPPNHYRLLGLRLHEADDDVISNALDQRLAFLRTLQAGKRGALSQKLLNEVSAAGTVLLDRKKKKAYDEKLKASQPATAAPANQPAAGTKSTLRTARPLPAAQLIAEVVPIPEPVAYVPAPVSMPQPVQPQVPPQPAYVVPIPVQMPVSAPPPPGYATAPGYAAASGYANAAGPEIVAPGSPAIATRRRSSRGGALAISIVAACAIVLTAMVGGVIWWSQRGHPPTANVPPTIPPTPVPETPTPLPNPTPPVPTPTPTPSTTVPATANPLPADPRKVWVYADNSRGGIRHVDGDRWVELSESAAIWYVQRETTPDAITLQQVGGSPLTVKLLADRLIRNDSERTGATVFFGKWRSLEGLPPFARRDPGQVQPQPPPNRKELRYGLLFDGDSQIEVPLPAELQKPGAKFTIELMARWLDPRQGACLLECGDLRLSSRVPQPGGGMMLALESGGKELQFGFPGGRDHTYYPTIVSDGSSVSVLMNGSPLPMKLSPPTLGRGPIRIGRDSRGDRGFRGVIQGLRVSEFDRLATVRAPATLSRELVADDLTLAAIDMRPQGAEKATIVLAPAGEGKRSGAPWVPLDSLLRLAAEPKPGEVDLLRSFIGQEHIVVGSFAYSANDIEIKSATGPNSLQLPYLPPPRYRLEANVTRTGGNGGLVLGLLLDDQPALLLVDADVGGKRATGFLTSGNSVQGGDPTGITSAPIASDTQQVVCEVQTDRGQADVRVTIGGNLVCHWRGKTSSVPVPEDWPLAGRTMFVGSRDATFRVTRLALVPIVPSGPIAGLPSRPPTLVPSPTPPVSEPMPPPAPAATTRHSPPDAATLARELEKARDIYADRLAKATRPEHKVTLATDIQKDATFTSSDPTARYVLLDLARKVYIQGGTVDDALAVATLLSREYDVSEVELVRATLESLDDVSLVARQRVAHAQAALRLAEELASEDKMAEAGKLAAMAAQSITRQSDAPLKRSIGQRAARIGRIAAGWGASQTHLATLAEKPDDAAANLALGKFYCFICERWPQGTECLIKSGNGAFATPAKLDREAADAKGRYAAAEAWLDLAESSNLATKEEKQAAQRRARRLLEMALSGLEGLDKIRAQKRFDAIGDVGESPLEKPAPRKEPPMVATPVENTSPPSVPSKGKASKQLPSSSAKGKKS